MYLKLTGPPPGHPTVDVFCQMTRNHKCYIYRHTKVTGGVRLLVITLVSKLDRLMVN